MTRRFLVPLSLVMLAALGSAAWWATRTREVPSHTPESSAEHRVDVPVAGASAAAASTGLRLPADAGRSTAAVAALLPTLPPAGTDPRRIVDALLPAADAGDRRAACRVAIELMTCQHAAAMAGERWVRGEMTAFGGPEVDERTVRMDAAIAAVDARCQEIPAATRARTAELLGAAARAGEPDAALLYAQGVHLRGHTMLDFFSHPGLDHWRGEAVPMVWRQLRAGDRRAVFLLAIAANDDFGLLDGLVRNDPATARAMWLLMSRLSGRRSTMAPLPPAQERRAAELAARWHRDHFNGRIVAEDHGPSTLVPPMPWIDGWEEPERCTGEIPR